MNPKSKKEEVLKDINKEELVRYILQEQKKRLYENDKAISQYKVTYGIKQNGIWLNGISKGGIWLNIKDMSIKEIYEIGFLQTFDYLLKTVLEDFIKFKKYDDPKQIKDLVWSHLKRELLHQPIAIMFNDLKPPIDFKSVGESFLEKEVPQHLESWKDKELFFDNLWKILEEINFADEEIGFAWRIAVER
jgi:hypothetical protein